MSEIGLNQDAELLSLKAKAISPKIRSICAQFDQLLDAIIKDVNEYIIEQEDEFILNCVQKSALKTIQDFLQFVDKNAELSLIGTGRLLGNLTNLCPSLKVVILAPKLLKKDIINEFISSNKIEPEWQEVKTKLEQKTSEIFRIWITKQKSNLKLANLTNDPNDNLKLMLSWEIIEISEQGEDDQIVKSKIRVPQNLSLTLFETLFKFCQSCHQVGIHSMPLNIQNELCQEAALSLAQVYQDFCCQNEKLTQNLALQFHFDVQFISQAMTNCQDKLKVQDKCLEIMSKLENHIDPFDLSVFSPYLSANVKRCILRHQSLLSVIIPNDKYTLLASMKASIPPKIEQQSDHNVMIMAPSCSRFALLPLMTSTNHSRGRELIKQKTLTASNISKVSSSPQRKRSKSPVAKAANSFFEAMSNSWFGTK